MRAWAKIKRGGGPTDVAVPTTVETVVATLAGISPRAADSRVELDGWVQLTIGAAGTAATVRVRRGTDTTGVLVGEGNPQTAAAGNNVAIPINVEDAPGEGTFTYVLTVQQTAATGGGTALQAALSATY